MSITLESAVRLGRDHSLSELNQAEGVVLDLKRKLFRGLNETALHILRELETCSADESYCSVEQLVSSTLDEFDVDRTVLEADIIEFLTVCLDKGIIEKRVDS